MGHVGLCVCVCFPMRVEASAAYADVLRIHVHVSSCGARILWPCRLFEFTVHGREASTSYMIALDEH